MTLKIDDYYLLPGDLVESKTGIMFYVISVRIGKSIIGITTGGNILTLDSSSVHKIIKRQLSWNLSKSLCEYCGKPLKNLGLCSDCSIGRGKANNTLLLGDFLQKKNDVCSSITRIVEMSFTSVSQRAGVMKIDVISKSLPMSFKYKDGSLEGLIYVLENQEQFNLINYINYFPETDWHGEYADIIERSYKVFPSLKNTMKALMPNQHPCNWCIYKGTKDCEVGDCNFKYKYE